MVGLRASWVWSALTDIALLIIAFAGAFTVRLGWPPPTANWLPLVQILPVVIVILPLAFYGFGLYMYQRQKRMVILRTLVMAEATLFVATLAGAFWLRGFSVPRSVIVMAFGGHLIMAAAWRTAAVALRVARPQRTVIAAPRVEAVHIVTKFLREPHNWYEIAAVSEPDEVTSELLSATGPVDLLVLGPTVVGIQRESLLRLALQIGATVYVVPVMKDILMTGFRGNQIDDLPVFEVRPMALTTTQRLMKRTFDLILTFPLLALSAPIMATVWCAIKVFTPGPALFKQTRVGLEGREFTVLKFRTMVVNAEEKTGPVFATAKDPRVTRLGDFLRATRLDELPQLWNVLRGEMSLVGPRPERPYFVAQFDQELPDYELRHAVPPGVTGLAQVLGQYGTTPEDKLRFDLFYIRQYSLWLDLRILLLTVQTVINKLGASELGSGRKATVARAEELVLTKFTRQ